MASSFRKMVHIKVLHNSKPIGEVKKPFRKTTRVTISNYRTRADLYLPFYNFTKTKENWEIISPSKNKLILNLLKESVCFLKQTRHS